MDLGGVFRELVTANMDKWEPLDPRNNSRADEIDADDLFDESKMPEANCPYCGAPLTTRAERYKDGTFMAWNMMPDPCGNPECQELERQRQEREDRKLEAEKRAQRKAEFDMILEDAIGGSGISNTDFLHLRFDTYEPQTQMQANALAQVRAYAAGFPERLCNQSRPDGDGKGLFICGTYGTGKTHLAKAVAVELVGKMYYTTVYQTDVRLYSNIKATYGGKGRSEREVMAAYTNASLLIIDDLGKSKITEWTMEKLFDIVDSRYMARRPIIVASNYTPMQMRDRLGAGSEANADKAHAIVSRLMECTVPVQLDGSDYRWRNWG